ncbi:hypothetical protein BJ742DRAFT_820550 [Cladochytrium replicatum]|nr:hypothetical protein BJ742DRAFT_820550 [Cladochytrium replicatum]
MYLFEQYETSEMTAPFPTTPFILDSHPDTAASKQRRASNRPTSKEAGNSDNPLLDHTNSDINEEFGVSQMIVELRQRLDQVVLERDEARTQAHKLHAVVEEMRSRLSMFEEKDKLSTSKILERVVEPWKSRTDKAEHLAKRLLEENERLRNKQTKLLGKALDIKLKLKDQTHEIASGSLPPHIHPYSLSTPPARGPTNATYSRKPLSSRVAGLAGPTGAAPPMAVLVEIATTLLGQSGTIQNSSNSAKATASSLIGSKYETLPAIPGAEREKTV